MKKMRIILAVVLAIALAFGMLSGAAAEGDEAVFELSLVPQEGTTNVLTALEDAEVGGTVTADLIIKNLSDAVKKINAFELEVDMSEELTFNTFTKAVPGNFTTQPSTETGLTIITFFSGSNSRIITLNAAGSTDGSDTKKVGTITFDVTNTGLIYGQVLEVFLTSKSNVHLSGTTVIEPCVFVKGQVEIVTKYSITWTGLVGEDEISTVGVGIVPEHSDPVKAGYTFKGWKDENDSVTAPGAQLPPATVNMTYTAQWEPTSYTVAFAEGTAFADGTTVPSSYNIEEPITVIPVQGGCTFIGWTAEPANEGATDYNWPTGVVTDTTAGYYGDVVLSPVWTVNADVVFAEYAYAGTGNKLMLVGIQGDGIDAGKAVFYGNESMFYTDDANYLALLNAAYEAGANSPGKEATQYDKAYLYIVAGTETSEGAIQKISVNPGSNTKIRHDGDLDGNGSYDSIDFGVVDDLLLARDSVADIQMRLEADVQTSEYDPDRMFGDVNDIIAIINKL